MTKKNYITASKTKRLQQHTSDSLTGTLLTGAICTVVSMEIWSVNYAI